MAKTVNPEFLKKKERVRAAVDLRGIPEGSEGRVLMSMGLDWIRYWVQWDNGHQMGSIHRDNLVRADEWDQFLVDREQALLNPVVETSAGEAGGDAAGAEAGGGATINGVFVTQLLLDRAQAALERFGVKR